MMHGSSQWFGSGFNVAWLSVLVGTLIFLRCLNLWPSRRSWKFQEGKGKKEEGKKETVYASPLMPSDNRQNRDNNR